jgi:predicted nucleotidyltransferase
VKVFWLDRAEAVERLRRSAERLLAARTDVRRVSLFGSLADDRAVPGSDADLLVLLDRSDARWIDRPLELLPFFDDVGLPIELFCYTPEEAARVPLARRALELGLPLAERP